MYVVYTEDLDSYHQNLGFWYVSAAASKPYHILR